MLSALLLRRRPWGHKSLVSIVLRRGAQELRKLGGLGFPVQHEVARSILALFSYKRCTFLVTLPCVVFQDNLLTNFSRVLT